MLFFIDSVSLHINQCHLFLFTQDAIYCILISEIFWLKRFSQHFSSLYKHQPQKTQPFISLPVHHVQLMYGLCMQNLWSLNWLSILLSPFPLRHTHHSARKNMVLNWRWSLVCFADQRPPSIWLCFAVFKIRVWWKLEMYQMTSDWLWHLTSFT